MRLTRKSKSKYAYWAITKNGLFAIGYSLEYFGKKTIQVFRKENNTWIVIREWSTYKQKIFNEIMTIIFRGFDDLEEHTKQWQEIRAILPPT